MEAAEEAISGINGSVRAAQSAMSLSPGLVDLMHAPDKSGAKVK
jgi:hypothetical protein